MTYDARLTSGFVPRSTRRKARAGLSFSGGLKIAKEPSKKRAVTFVDGQNLFHAAREVFGYTYPNYDVTALARNICRVQEWSVEQVRFYTGTPNPADDPFWSHFWETKLRVMTWHGVAVYSRPLRYRERSVKLPDGSEHIFTTGEEKGIDVRIAIDVIRMALRDQYDVALILSQDQDLSEVAEEIRVIAHERDRWIKIASAFPSSDDSTKTRGINKTDWIRIDRTLYDQCIDKRDYRREGNKRQ